MAGRGACALLGDGPALTDVPEADWVVDLRVEHAAQLRAARHVTAEALLRAGDITGAVEAAQAAVRVDRLDEPAHRLLMAAYQAGGEPTRALGVYERLRMTLLDELGVDPAPRPVPCSSRCSPGPPCRRRPGRGVPDRARDVDRSGPGGPHRGGGSAHRHLGRGRRRPTRATPDRRRRWHRQDPAGGGACADVEATGGRVLTARCYTGERSLFLQPLVDALDSTVTALRAARLRALVGPRAPALTGLWPELADELGTAVEHGTPEIEVRRAFEAVTAVLRGLAADRPTLLLLDDLHQAGLTTVELLHYLARHVAPARLLVLATLRTDEGADASRCWPRSRSGSISARCRTRR